MWMVYDVAGDFLRIFVASPVAFGSHGVGLSTIRYEACSGCPCRTEISLGSQPGGGFTGKGSEMPIAVRLAQRSCLAFFDFILILRPYCVRQWWRWDGASAKGRPQR